MVKWERRKAFSINAGAGIWTRVESLEGFRARPVYTTPAQFAEMIWIYLAFSWVVTRGIRKNAAQP